MQIKWSVFVDRKKWASLTPEGWANRSWRPRGEGSTVTPCLLYLTPAPCHISPHVSPSWRCSHFWTILKHHLLQSTNTPMELLCTLSLVFSSFDSPALPLLSTPQVWLPVLLLDLSRLCYSPQVNPYCCSIGIWCKILQKEIMSRESSISGREMHWGNS